MVRFAVWLAVIAGFAGFAGFAGCTKDGAPHASPQVAAPAPAIAPQAAPFARETPALANAEALAYLPVTTSTVAVAASLDQLDAALLATPALTMFGEIAGFAPAGLARTRPVGLAAVPGGWIAFGYVDDANAFAASVPARQRTRRGALGFVAASPDEIALVLPEQDRPPALAAAPEFRRDVDALHYGALIAWWIERSGAVGVGVDGATLRVRTVGGAVVPPERQRITLRTGIGGFDELVGGIPQALFSKRETLTKQRDAAIDALELTRHRAVIALAQQLGLLANPPSEQTFIAPAASVKAWLAPTLDRWRDVVEQTALNASERQLAVVERQIQAAMDDRDNSNDTRPPVPEKAFDGVMPPVPGAWDGLGRARIGTGVGGKTFD